MAAVDVFYKKVLADPEVRPFFEGLDMGTQVMKQIAFVTFAFGGPAEYHGRDMHAAHARLVREKGLNASHFDNIVRHFEATLRELDVADDLIQESLHILQGTRGEVLRG